jgi:hypothetical protein
LVTETTLTPRGVPSGAIDPPPFALEVDPNGNVAVAATRSISIPLGLGSHGQVVMGPGIGYPASGSVSAFALVLSIVGAIVIGAGGALLVLRRRQPGGA